MFETLQHLFNNAMAQTPDSAQHALGLQTATAALLLEVAGADFERDEVELRTIETVLSQHFDLDAKQVQALMEAAQHASDNAASLYRFTHDLHAQLDRHEKRQVVEMLWRVAFADHVLDGNEDALMHKIARLLYVPNGELMQAKNKVQTSIA